MAVNTRLWKQNAAGQSSRKRRVIKNSEVVMVGDWITDEGTGCADVDAVTEKVLGFVTAIVNANGTSLESPSVETGDLDGTWASSTKQFTANSDNADSGGDGVMAEYVPAREGDEYIGVLDADKGTSTGSNKAGYYLAVSTSDASLLDESSASTSAANCQFMVTNAYGQGADTEVVVTPVLRESDQYTND